MSRTKTTLALAAIIAAALTGCATQTSHGSRVELYDSVDKLAADSSVVVVGSVQSTKEVEDMPGLGRFTLSDFLVEDVVSPTVTGAERASDAPNPTVRPGETITVRQMGGGGGSAPAEFLSADGQYMLFLKPTQLEGPAADDFYVTGVTAGIYIAANQGVSRGSLDREFEHYDTKYEDMGDDLPPTLGPDELATR